MKTTDGGAAGRLDASWRGFWPEIWRLYPLCVIATGIAAMCWALVAADWYAVAVDAVMVAVGAVVLVVRRSWRILRGRRYR